jgi:ABC-type dipeptide/oligopeptide/nickel transport system permease subunit
VEAAIARGLSTRQIIIRHILPNIFPVLVPFFLYGISVVLLTESGLAFLGLGVSPGTVTWGNLIAQGKENIQAWWLMLCPGLMILFTVLSLNSVRKVKITI